MHSNNVKAKRGAKEYAVRRPGVMAALLVGMAVAALLLATPATAREGEAEIRMVHLSPDAPAVNVEIDGESRPALADVSFRHATPYVPLSPGPHDIAVYAVSDPSEPVLEVSVNPKKNQAYTIAGTGLLSEETFSAKLFEDDLEAPEEGRAKVRVVHAIPDIGAATVNARGGPELFAIPGFANASDYAEVEAGTHTLDVIPAGDEEPALAAPKATLREGEVYTAYAIGQVANDTRGIFITADGEKGKVVFCKGQKRWPGVVPDN